ncbi:MAG: aspartyl-phosphate phosphatase Spo0E family protein [bacterium]|jgi:hypothetical protein
MNYRKELAGAIEELRSKLYHAVSDNPKNVKNSDVQELSSALDKLIVQWVKN